MKQPEDMCSCCIGCSKIRLCVLWDAWGDCFKWRIHRIADRVFGMIRKKGGDGYV